MTPLVPTRQPLPRVGLPHPRAAFVLLILLCASGCKSGDSGKDESSDSQGARPSARDNEDEDAVDDEDQSTRSRADAGDAEPDPMQPNPVLVPMDAGTDGAVLPQLPDTGPGDASPTPGDARPQPLDTSVAPTPSSDGSVSPAGPPIVALIEEATVISIASDATGALHVAAVVGTASGNVVYYGRCTQRCTDQTAWTFGGVDSADPFVIPTIAVTADGRPRIAYTKSLPGTQGKYYAECNASCEMTASWTRIAITGTLPTPSAVPRRMPFAVSPGGRAVVGHTDSAGSLAFYCAANCGDVSSWSSVGLGDGNSFPESVALPNETDLHMVLRRSNGGTTGNSLYWLNCTADCAMPANWTASSPIWEVRAFTMSAEITTSPSGMPRVAVFAPEPNTPVFANPYITYLACDSNCNATTSWTSVRPPVGMNNGQIGFTLGRNLPTGSDLALATLDTIGLLDCSGDCGATSWTAPAVFKTTSLNARYPLAVPRDCVGSYWTVYSGPSIARTPAGRVLAFGAKKNSAGKVIETAVCDSFGYAAFLVFL